MSNHSKLLPCPFCGEESLITKHKFRTSINCVNPACWSQQKGPQENEAQLIAAWNKRPGITVSKEAIERAASALKNRIHQVQNVAIPALTNREGAWRAIYEDGIKSDHTALDEINKAIADSKTE